MSDEALNVLSVAAYGEYETLRDMLTNDKDLVDYKDSFGISPLIEASRNGQLNAVEVLLSFHCDVNQTDLSGKTALHYAAGGGYLPIVKLLVENNCLVNQQDIDGKTALHWASYNDEDEIEKYLIGHKANGNILDNNGLPALKWMIPFMKNKQKLFNQTE
ncbi:hypothetical protein WA158_004050 [Blastocystis sp. Blastoise]